VTAVTWLVTINPVERSADYAWEVAGCARRSGVWMLVAIGLDHLSADVGREAEWSGSAFTAPSAAFAAAEAVPGATVRAGAVAVVGCDRLFDSFIRIWRIVASLARFSGPLLSARGFARASRSAPEAEPPMADVAKTNTRPNEIRRILPGYAGTTGVRYSTEAQ
jgi:hypothetical protein